MEFVDIDKIIAQVLAPKQQYATIASDDEGTQAPPDETLGYDQEENESTMDLDNNQTIDYMKTEESKARKIPPKSATTKSKAKKGAKTVGKKKKAAIVPKMRADSFTQKTLNEIHLEGSVTDTLTFLQAQLENTVSILNSGITQLNKQQGSMPEVSNDKLQTSLVLDPAKHVFATMLTDDSYLPGVQLLHFSICKHVNQELQRQDALKKVNDDLDTEEPLSHSEFSERIKNLNFQLVVLCGEKLNVVTMIQLKKLSNIIIKKVPDIPNPFEETNSTPGADGKMPSWVGSGYTKLNIWGLTEYDLVYYIDADCLVQSTQVLQAFKRMLAKPSAVLGAAPDVFPPDNFNAGVLIIKPSLEVLRKMLNAIDKINPYDGGDTGFLNSFYPDWFDNSNKFVRLEYGFNAQRTLQLYTQKRTMGYWNEVVSKGIKIIHYSSSPKPWSGKSICEADLIWQQYMIEYSSSLLGSIM